MKYTRPKRTIGYWRERSKAAGECYRDEIKLRVRAEKRAGRFKDALDCVPYGGRAWPSRSPGNAALW